MGYFAKPIYQVPSEAFGKVCNIQLRRGPHLHWSPARTRNTVSMRVSETISAFEVLLVTSRNGRALLDVFRATQALDSAH